MVVILRGNDVVVEWRLAFSSEEFEYEAGRFYVYAGVKQTDAEYEIRDNVLYSTIPGNQLEAGLYSMVFAFTSYKGDELVLNKRKVSGAFVITEDEEEVVDGPVICDTSAYGRTLYSLLDVDSSSDNSSVNGAEEGNVLTFQNGLWRGVKVEADLTDVEGKIELITVTLEDHEARIEKVESSVGDTDKKIAANTQLITGLREYLNSLFAVVYKEDGTIDYVRTPHNFASDKTVSSLGVGGDGGAGSLGFSILQSWDDDSDASEVMALGSNLGRELYDSISVIKDENLKGISSRVDDIESELDSVSQTLTQHGTSIQNNRVSISEINERISPIEKVFNEIKTWFTLEGDVLRTTYSLASDQTVSSLGVGSDNGGSGVSYDRLDNWDNYVEGDGSVLSSDLGYGLLERIIDLEEGTSGDYASIEEKVDKNTNAITALSTSLNDFLTGVDVDDTINRWKELEKFLEGYKETATLADLLKGKVDTEAYNTAINGINETLGIHTTAINSNTANIASINTTLLNHDTRITNNANAITKIEKTLADWFTLEDGVLHSKYGLASDKTVSSLGIGSSEGGGASYNRLDAWSSYTADKAGYVLSALLGWDLNTRLGKIESGDIGDISLSNYYTKSEVFNRTEIDNMLLGYAKSEDIPAIPTALKNPYSLKFGSKSYDGSTEMTITAADLGALTEHQTIYNLTMQAGAFSVKTFDPNGSAQTVNIPTTTDHIAEGSNKYYSNTLVSNYLTGAVSSVLTSNLTASRALISNANGKIAVSAVTSTELGYLDGVTSAIQTQLNALSSRIKAYEDILKIEEEGKLLHATVALASDSTLSSLGVGSDEDGGVGSVIDLTNVVTDILPAADDTYSIGGADLRWSDIWGVIGRFDTLLADDIRTTDGVSYVTQAWVENNFVKHATLDSYATKAELIPINNSITSLQQSTFTGAEATNYYRLTWFTSSGGNRNVDIPTYQGKGFASIEDVDGVFMADYKMVYDILNYVDAKVASGGSVNLSNYYTKSEVHSYVAQEINTFNENLPVIPTKTSQLTNDSGFITSSAIPSLTGYAKLSSTNSFTAKQSFTAEIEVSKTDLVAPLTVQGTGNRAFVKFTSGSTNLGYLGFSAVNTPAWMPSDATEYLPLATQAWVEGKGYATTSDLNNLGDNIGAVVEANFARKATTLAGYGITDGISTSNIGSQSVSYATSAFQSTLLRVTDTRNENYSPYGHAYVKGVSWHLRNYESIGLGYIALYGGMLTLTPWSDASGGNAHQLCFFGDNIYHRSGSSEWSTWRQLAFIESNVASATKATQDGEGNVITTSYAKKATTLAGYGITDGVNSYSKNLTTETETVYDSIFDYLPTTQSLLGGLYTDVWWHVISARHSNGYSDGNKYGLVLYSDYFTGTSYDGGGLYWAKQMNGNWYMKNLILDSSNFSDYALPLSGGTITINSYKGITIKRDASNTGGLLWFANNSGYLGAIGFNANNECYIDTGSTEHKIIHSGNIGSYAITKDGGEATGRITAPTMQSGSFQYDKFVNYGSVSGSNSANWYTVYSCDMATHGDCVTLHLTHSYYYMRTESVTLVINIGYSYDANIVQIGYNAEGSRAFQAVRVRVVNAEKAYIDVYIWNSVPNTDTFFVNGTGRGVFQAPTLASSDGDVASELSLVAGCTAVQEDIVVGGYSVLHTGNAYTASQIDEKIRELSGGNAFTGGSVVSTIYPSTDNGASLGTSSNRWHSGYIENVYSSGINAIAIELNPDGRLQGCGGFIDFHFNGSTDDYTCRIIEDGRNNLFINSSYLRLAGATTIGSQQDLAGSTYKLYVNGNSYMNGSLNVADGLGLTRTEANYIWATGGSSSYLLFGVANVGATSWGNASLRITTAGNVEISKSLTVSGDILPSTTDTQSLGSTSSYWKNLYVGIITGHYQSGDVVKFSGSINATEGNISCKSLTVNGVAITGSGGSFSGGTVANDTLFSGVVSIGSSMPSSYASKLYVNGSATFEGFIDAFGGIAGDGWEIMESGDAYFTSVSQGSDYNLKNIIGDVRLSLGMMACAPLVLFDWKNKSNTKHNVGTIAQYWQGVLPEVVTKTMNGTLALSYGELGVAMGISLANILEDTNGRVATVEEEIKTLKEENKRLKERVAELEAA